MKLSLLLAISLPAWGTTLFSSFGPGQTYGAGGLSIDGASFIFGYQAVTFAFNTTAPFTVTQVDLAVEGTGSAIVRLYDSSGSSGGPGVILASWTLPTLNFGSLQQLTSPGVGLAGKKAYWLVVLPGTNDTSGYWADNPQGVLSGAAVSHDGTTWSVDRNHDNSQGAFDIVGNVITPEPGSCLLAGFGLAACAGFRRYQIRQRRAR